MLKHIDADWANTTIPRYIEFIISIHVSSQDIPSRPFHVADGNGTSPLTASTPYCTCCLQQKGNQSNEASEEVGHVDGTGVGVAAASAAATAAAAITIVVVVRATRYWSSGKRAR